MEASGGRRAALELGDHSHAGRGERIAEAPALALRRRCLIDDGALSLLDGETGFGQDPVEDGPGGGAQRAASCGAFAALEAR